MPTLSIWPLRLLDVINVLAGKLSTQPQDPSLERAELLIPWEAMSIANHIDTNTSLLSDYVASPWILSLCMYARVGVSGYCTQLSPLKLDYIRECLGPVRNAGWTNIDILQVIELCKEVMIWYPTDEQWSIILTCSVDDVVQARLKVKPTLLECFSPIEQVLWDLGGNTSFLVWVDTVKNSDMVKESFELIPDALNDQSI